jgi:hypothetical protein
MYWGWAGVPARAAGTFISGLGVRAAPTCWLSSNTLCPPRGLSGFAFVDLLVLG